MSLFFGRIGLFFATTFGKFILAGIVLSSLAAGAVYLHYQIQRSGEIKQELKHEKKARKAVTKMQQAPVPKTKTELKDRLRKGEF